MALRDDLARIAAVAEAFAEPGEELAGVLPAEPQKGERVYLCAFSGTEGQRTWLALDDAGRTVRSRVELRDAVSITALCELAEETAAGGDLDELRSRLVALRLTDNPPGIDEAEEAVLELQRAIGAPPRVATPAHLDEIGAATRRLEQALGDAGRSPFAEAMKLAVQSVDSLTTEVETNYRGALS